MSKKGKTAKALHPIELHRGIDYIRLIRAGSHTDDVVAEIVDGDYANPLASSLKLLAALKAFTQQNVTYVDGQVVFLFASHGEARRALDDARKAVAEAEARP